MAEDAIEIIPSGGVYSLASNIYPNLSAFPGQLNVLPWDISARQETEWARDKAVVAGRQAERTSENIRGGIDKHTDMVVGARLQVRPTPEWDILGPAFTPEARTEFADACRAWFNNWAYDTRLLQDAEGHYDFGGQMWMAYRNMTGPDAETAGVILYDEERMAEYGGNWATYVQVLDPSRIATPGLLTGRELELNIFQGKKLDKDGRWIGMYVKKSHPNENSWDWNDYAYVPRETPTGRTIAWHSFEKTRGNAQRGMTSLVTLIKSVTQLDKFMDAHLGSAILNSMFAMFVSSNADAKTVGERMAPNPAITGGVSFEERLKFYKDARIRFGEKRVPVLPEGDKIEMTNVNRASEDPTAFVNLFLRPFASATGTTFEQMANNWSDANYSAARAALLDLWRMILRKRFRFGIVPSLCYGAVIEEAIARGRIKLPAGAPPFQEFRHAYTKCVWMGPAMGQIDPEKEAKAQEIRLRNRTTNRDIECAEDGNEYYEVFQQFALEVEEADDLGFTLEPPVPGSDMAAADGGGDPVAAGDKPKPKKSGKSKAKPKEE